MTRSPVDARNQIEALRGFHGIAGQKACHAIRDHLTAGAEVHRDHGHARCIGFRQDQAESLRDGVEMEQSVGAREQLIFPGDVDRPDEADVRAIEMRLDLFLESRLCPEPSLR